MDRLPIRWIAARTYCQATEEEERVAMALDAAVVGGTAACNALEGQFGNPVVVLTRRLEDRMDVRATWARWRDAGVLAELGPTVAERVDDDAVLHFRIDKQEAYLGRLALAKQGDAIDIQVKIEAYPASATQVCKVARSLVEEAA